jgi:hypothetical protein
MSYWTDHELTSIGNATELQLAPRGRNGALRPYTTMWVVRVGEGLYIRSANGVNVPLVLACESEWDRSDPSRRDRTRCHLRRGGRRRAAEIDSAYWSKYGRYGERIVGTVTGPEREDVTIKLVPAGTS